ncbi:multidrug DMT transporter permease, partial [Corynebacterium bovis]
MTDAPPPTRRPRPDPLVLGLSTGFTVLFVALTVVFGDRARAVYTAGAGWLLANLNWLYIGGVSLSLL